MLYIEPTSILTPQGHLGGGAVLVDGGRIVAVGAAGDVACPPDATRVPAAGYILAPGFIDLQINGGFGFDFTADPSTMWEVASHLPRYGVTSFLPTIISAPLDRVSAAQRVIAQGPPPRFSGATPLGLHLEGPFLNHEKRGAHNPDYLRLPDLSLVSDWSPERGVRLVTLAPELPGALDMVMALSRRDVVVSAGHSMATYAQALAGIAAGITYGTHLFNAMAPPDHRRPGLAGVLLTDLDVRVGLIADGIHVHPSMVDLAWRALGPRHLNLVTDAMSALGMPPGIYRLGDRDVTLGNASARLADGRLAGSLLSLDQAVRNLVSFTHCPPEEALSTVTEVPAAVLGMGDARGKIAEGCIADLVLLRSDLSVATTIVAGEVVFATM